MHSKFFNLLYAVVWVKADYSSGKLEVLSGE
jgi:hypothetical protein